MRSSSESGILAIPLPLFLLWKSAHVITPSRVEVVLSLTRLLRPVNLVKKDEGSTMRVDTTRSELWAMADFRENLVQLRRERKLTQLQLAELLGVQPRLISRWETGDTR